MEPLKEARSLIPFIHSPCPGWAGRWGKGLAAVAGGVLLKLGAAGAVFQLWQLRQDTAFASSRPVTAWGCSTQILTNSPLCPVQQALHLGTKTNWRLPCSLPHPLLVRLSSYQQ